MKADMIWLTSPVGNAYFDPQEIVAISEAYSPFTDEKGEQQIVRSNVWLRGNNDPFNILEDPEVILQRMQIADPAPETIELKD
jgi:hypothetical protein